MNLFEQVNNDIKEAMKARGRGCPLYILPRDCLMWL